MVNKYICIFPIVKAAITGQSAALEKTVDYDWLFSLSKQHQIIPLIYTGLANMNIVSSKIDKFCDYTMKAIWFDQNQMYCLNKIKELFQSNKIDYMLLKGSSLKKNYPSSELRLMGDVDILIKEIQYQKIRQILSDNGFKEGKQTDHELMWKSQNGMLIELHKRLIPSYNDDYYEYYKNPWLHAIAGENHEFYMSPEDEYIYIFTHLTKHYRDGGIGLRHIIDIWVYELKHPNLDWKYLNSELDKLGLRKFNENIRDAIHVWFDGEKETDMSEYITKRIIESGSYGIKEMHDMANASRQSARYSSVHSAKAASIFKLIFLPYSSMKKQYPVLKKCPFLLPIMWVIRWIDALKNKKDSITRQLERLNKINASVVEKYNDELDYVGLKFNLKK